MVTAVLLRVMGMLIAFTLGGEARAAGSTVYLNAAFANRPVEPSSFGPKSGPGTIIDNPNYVQALEWSSWGGEAATGTGRVRLEALKIADTMSVPAGG